MTVVDCPKCDGNGSYYFAGGNLDCSWCRGTGKMEDKDAQDYTDNRNKAYNNASDLIHNTDGFIDGSDVPTSGIYESKASEDVTFAGRGDIVTYEDLWKQYVKSKFKGSRLVILVSCLWSYNESDK